MTKCAMIIWGSEDEDINIYLVTLNLFDRMMAKERRKVFDLLYQDDELNPEVLKLFICQAGVIESVDFSEFEIVKIYMDG